MSSTATPSSSSPALKPQLARLGLASLGTLLPLTYFTYFVASHYTRQAHAHPLHDEAESLPICDAFPLLLRTSLLTGIFGIVVAMALQSLVAYLLARLCFGGTHAAAVKWLTECGTSEPVRGDVARVEERKRMSRDPRYWVFTALFCLLGAAAVEEVIKLVGVSYVLDRIRGGERSTMECRDVGWTAATVGMGYGTVENLAFFVSAAVAAVRKKNDGDSKNNSQTEKTSHSQSRFWIFVLGRVVVGMPGHAMTAALIGLTLALESVGDRSTLLLPHSSSSILRLWRILRVAVLLHSSSNTALFAVSAWDGNVGWVHPEKTTSLATALAAVAVFQGILAALLREKISAGGVC